MTRRLLCLAALTACSSPPGDGAGTSWGGSPSAEVDLRPPDASTALLPDLTIDRQRAIVDLALERRSFETDSCELTPEEACIDGPGERTLLRFAVETPNIGNADMVLGTPRPQNDNFVYSPCHDHYHFEGYAEYRLIEPQSGNDAATGQKQAFCLLDSTKYVDDPDVPEQEKYSCFYQGIQRGWSDVYHARLPCQWIDVTDVAAGTYQLEISLNNDRTLEELTYHNNVARITVRLDDPALSTPTEPCPEGFSHHALDGDHRECGWTLERTIDCTPGHKMRIGCAASCNVGSCTGDPMMRVCDHARPDGNCSYAGNLESSRDACNSSCPRIPDVYCPASGKLDVYAAPEIHGAAYTCQVEAIDLGA